jgi:hypothetical protein
MKKSKCRTRGTWFCFRLGSKTQWASSDNSAEFLITLPPTVVMTKYRAKRLEKVLHDAAENLMAPWFETREAKKAIKEIAQKKVSYMK